MPDRRHLEGALDALARRQHGVFSRQQVAEIGFTPRQVGWRLDTSRWLRLDTAVYGLPSHPPTWERQVMAATLSVPSAVASGRSAGRLHHFPDLRAGRPEILAPPGRNERSALALVHRGTFVRATAVEGVPCQRPSVAVLELATRLGPTATADLVDHLALRDRAFLDELVDVFVRWSAGRRPGTRLLRSLLETRTDDAWTPPESVLEARLREVLEHPTLPPFQWQARLPWRPDGRGRVDAYSPVARLVVEADGRAWHARERDFVADRQRDNLAMAQGIAVLRFTWFDLTSDPAGCRRLVLATAHARGWPADRPSGA